jgi:hypothetical protein
MTVTTGARGRASPSAGHVLVGEGFRIVQRRHDGLVAHFLDHDHGGVLVQRLVDGDHLAQLHQVLDHLGRLDRHLVRQFGHGDGFGHVHFQHAPPPARPGAWSSRSRSLPRRPRGPPRQLLRPTPPEASPRVLISFFLAGSPAQLDDSLADLTSLPAPAPPARWCAAARRAAGAGADGRLVQRALDAGLAASPGLATGLGSSGFLATSTFLGVDIIERMAAASASALRRRSPRSAARAASSSARALDSAAAFSRGFSCGAARRSGFGRSRFRDASSLLLGRGLGLFLFFGGVAGGALFGLALALLGSSRSWRRFSPALLPGGGSAQPGGGLLPRGGPVRLSSLGAAARASTCWAGLGRFGHGLRTFVALDEGALLAHFDLDGAGLAGGVGLLDLAGGLLHQRDLLALGRSRAVAGLQVAQQLCLSASVRASDGDALGTPALLSCSSSVSVDFLSSLQTRRRSYWTCVVCLS